MKLKLFANSLIDKRNIGILIVSGAAAYLSHKMLAAGLIPGHVFYSASFLVYLGFTVQSLYDERFVNAFLRKQNARNIRNLNNTCLKLASYAKKHTNVKYYKKLKKVMDDRNDIYESYLHDEQNLLKEKIVEKTLNLVVYYIKLLTNFCKRSRELAHVKTDEIISRLNENTRKVNFAKDPSVVRNLNQLIELDRKMFQRINDEKIELERIKTKLDYMESSVRMLKHQILSNIESQETLDRLEDAINEAVALDNVLESRKKQRVSY